MLGVRVTVEYVAQFGEDRPKKNKKFMTHKIRLRLPPHLYLVSALPSKTHTTANIDATCFIFDVNGP